MRKSWTVAVLVAAQLAASVPAYSAELDGRSPFVENQRGAFAGVRLRAKLGAETPDLRASLAIVPTSHSRKGAASRMAMGDGLELSFSPGKVKPELTLAGKRLDRMDLFDRPSTGDRANLSTLAKVAIVAGVVVVVGYGLFLHALDEASCFHGGSDGDC